MEPVMRVCGLRKDFASVATRRGRVRAVDGVSFDLARGETLGVIGESGCGKSTLARLLCRLVRPTTGAIRLGDQELLLARGERLRALRRRVQIIFQDAEGSLDPRMRVRDLVIEPLLAQGITTEPDTAPTLLRSVSLTPDLLDRYPHQLSGGQRQRVGFARALCLEPDIVVADEPAASLDPSTQAALLSRLRDLQATRGLSTVLITHNLRLLRLLADRVAVMYLGRFVEIGPTERIFARPRHPYTQAILATLDVLAGRTPTTELLGGDPPSPLSPPDGCAFHPRCPHTHAPCLVDPPALLDDGTAQHVACHLVSAPTSTTPSKEAP